MTTKYPTRHPIKQRDRHNNDQPSFLSSFYSSDPTQAEREAQRQEFLRKEQKEIKDFRETKFLRNHDKKPQQKQKQPVFSKTYSLEETLERTWAWLLQTFPHLFDEIKPLDIHILRDIKAHYKTYQTKRQYPPDLAIKATLHRYIEKPEYLLQLKEGASRYSVVGNPIQTVTKEEQEEAIKKLEEMGMLK